MQTSTKVDYTIKLEGNVKEKSEKLDLEMIYWIFAK